MSKKEAKNRYNLIDILRGIAVICMIIYHTMWDIVYMMGVDIPFFRTSGAHIFQQYILWSFVIISGFCVALGKKTLRRGAIVFGISVAMGLFTIFFMPEAAIYFGVLTFLGSAMIITELLKKPLSKLPYYIGIPLSAIIFFITFNISDHSLGFGKLILYNLPDRLYINHLTAFLGFPHNGFNSADYVPLLPWIFLYWFGFYAYKLFKDNDLLKYLSVKRLPFAEWLGKHALEIYVAHQPLIYGILFLINYLNNQKFIG